MPHETGESMHCIVLLLLDVSDGVGRFVSTLGVHSSQGELEGGSTLVICVQHDSLRRARRLRQLYVAI